MKSIHSALLVASVVCSLSVQARAQTFYVDCNSPMSSNPSPPSAGYGAAYGVPGVWNAVPFLKGLHPLVDSTGAAGSVSAYVETNCDSQVCEVPALTGDDAALLSDFWAGDCYASPNIITLSGLAGGVYQVFAFGYYACSPSQQAHISVESNSGSEVLYSGGVPFPGNWTDFPVGRKLLTVPEGGYVRFQPQNFTGLAGFQLVRLGADPTPYCFGHLGDCPCDAGAPGHGCPSSFNADGAHLGGTGSANLDADTVVLTASGLSNSVATFLQGDTLLGQGFGIPFGDGLRCTGGQVVRLASKLATGGVVVYPEAGELPISIRGLIPPGGGLRGYQVWYRNPTDHCTGATHNFTNAVAVDWE